MATNLLDLLGSEFSGDVLGKVASAIGENPALMQKAVSGAMPLLLGSMSHKASTPQGAGELFNLFQQGGFDGGKFGGLGSLLGSATGGNDLMKMGGPLVSALLGTRQNSALDWLSSFGGVSRNGALQLLGLATPVVMNLIGKTMKSSGGFNLSTLQSLLGGQSQYLRSAPSGLAGALGLANWDDLGRAARVVEEPVRKGGSIWRWLLPLLALIPLIWMLRSCRTETPAVVEDIPQQVEEAVESVKSMYGDDLGAWVQRKLANGFDLRLPTKGVEVAILDFIDDPSRAISKDVWFTLDRTEFDINSAVMKPAAAEQIGNLAEIMKGYPNVKIKVGGYTDNTGDAAANLKLSDERAHAAKAALVALGVDASRIEAEGYGDQHPLASNDTEDGRARNRRIDIRLTAK